MAEAADQGIRKLLLHCQTPRAIPMLVQALKTDKNARIRSSCAAYLALVRGCECAHACEGMLVLACWGRHVGVDAAVDAHIAACQSRWQALRKCRSACSHARTVCMCVYGAHVCITEL